MARIAGVDLPKKKRLEVGLTYIYGVGRSLSKKICSEAQVSSGTHVENLTEQQEIDLRKVIEKLTVEGDLRRSRNIHVKRLIDLGCYRGVRHRKGLPVRGQSTRQNARTRKGPKKTVANKKKAV